MQESGETTPKPGPPRGSPPAGPRDASAQQPERARPASSGLSVRSPSDPTASTPVGHTAGGSIPQPIPSAIIPLSPPKADPSASLQKPAPPCPALPFPSRKDRSRGQERDSSTDWTSLRAGPEQAARPGVRLGRSLSEQLCGPMAFLYLRVRTNEARGAGLPPRLGVVVRAPTPGSGGRCGDSIMKSR